MIIGDQTGRRIVFTESGCSCCIEKIDENAYCYDGMDPGDGTEYPYMIVFHSNGRGIVLGVYASLGKAEGALSQLIAQYKTKGYPACRL